MNVLRILVDELPECCNDCWFHEYVEGCKTDHHFCVGNNGDNHDIPDPYDGRMNWCPLEAPSTVEYSNSTCALYWVIKV